MIQEELEIAVMQEELEIAVMQEELEIAVIQEELEIAVMQEELEIAVMQEETSYWEHLLCIFKCISTDTWKIYAIYIEVQYTSLLLTRFVQDPYKWYQHRQYAHPDTLSYISDINTDTLSYGYKY